MTLSVVMKMPPKKQSDSPGFIGTKFTLYNLFGWYQASPVNLTQAEEDQARVGISGIENQNNASGSKITDSFKASDNPVKRMADMSAMADSDLVGPLLEVYAEEASQPDINKGKCLWYECSDPAVEKDLNEMLDRINAEDHMFSLFMGVAGRGNEFRRVLYNADGVQQLVGIPCNEMRRLWEPTTKRLLGFKWNGQRPRKDNVIFPDDEDIFPPWDFIHFRRLYRSDTEYGVAILDKLYSLWRKLEMSIDQMVLYRLHTMPNRIAMYVDIGDQDVTDSMETLHIYQTMMRQRLSLNQAGLDSRYDMPALDSILYIPIRPNESTKMETLAGDKDVPDIPDIESMKKSLHGGARIPPAYVGHGEDSGNLSQSSLVSQDIRFARMIRVIRRPAVAGFYRLAQLHLAFTGKDPKSYDIKVQMSRISSIEEEVNATIMEKQVGIAHSLTDLCQALGIPNREIIDLVFREYLSVPRYFIDIAKLGVSIQGALGGEEEGGGGGGMGGGMGGMGGGIDDMDLDAPPPDDIEEPLTPPPIESRRSQRKNSLVEQSTTQRDVANLKSMVRAIAKAVYTNKGKKDESVEKAIWRFKTVFREHMAVGAMRRTSLVEDYHGGVDQTEAAATIGARSPSAAGTMLLESFSKTAESVKISEAVGNYDSSTEDETQHPQTASRNRMRSKPLTEEKQEEVTVQHEAVRIRKGLR